MCTCLKVQENSVKINQAYFKENYACEKKGNINNEKIFTYCSSWC